MLNFEFHILWNWTQLLGVKGGGMCYFRHCHQSLFHCVQLHGAILSHYDGLGLYFWTEMVVSWFELISMGQLGLCQLSLGQLQWTVSAFIMMDSVGSGFHGVYDAAAGAAGAGVTGFVDLTYMVAGMYVDIVGATTPVMGASGLMASKWHSQMWSWAHWYCPLPMTCN